MLSLRQDSRWMTCNGGAISPPIWATSFQYPRHYDCAEGTELKRQLSLSVTATPAGHHDESKAWLHFGNTIAMTTNTPIRQ